MLLALIAALTATALAPSKTIAHFDASASPTRNTGHDNPKGLFGDPAAFPIAVWMQTPANAPEFQAIGINLFVGLWKGPTEAQLAQLVRWGMPVIAEQNSVALNSPNAKIIRGWTQGDEPDNSQPLLSGRWGPCVPAAEVARRSMEMKASDPSRPIFIGFGRGAADPNWIGRGLCTGDTGYYDTAMVGADIVAFDVYPVSSHDLGANRLDAPAEGVRRLKAKAREGQRVWAWIETTKISGQARVTPGQLKSEVWLAIIAGADGIGYFVHEWTGGFREDGVFRYPEIVAAIANNNTLIKKLAPVLNSPTLAGRVTTSGTISSATMVKAGSDGLYLFTGSTDPRPGSLSFKLIGPDAPIAQVIDENRQVAIRDGTIHDAFTPYQIHIYHIAALGRRSRSSSAHTADHSLAGVRIS
jgi:hypothetical protein